MKEDEARTGGYLNVFNEITELTRIIEDHRDAPAKLLALIIREKGYTREGGVA